MAAISGAGLTRMPEPGLTHDTSCLKLKSAFGTDPKVYSWPLATGQAHIESSGDEATEIFDTIR